MTIFIYPTDTVWGLGASIYDRKAQLRIAEIKGTDPHKPLSILMPTLEDVKEYFNFPSTTNFDVLKKIFKSEATLGLPLSWIKKEIPTYIYSGSSWIGIRCVELVSLKTLSAKAQGPVTTTSLNYSGDKPIITMDEALAFAKKFSECTFIPLHSEDPPMSGRPSCLMSFDDVGRYQMVRPGRFNKQLLDLAKQLF